jgi:hypothetical protein
MAGVADPVLEGRKVGNALLFALVVAPVATGFKLWAVLERWLLKLAGDSAC